MAFADNLAAINEWYFFREFTYSKTTFRPSPSKETELADAIIWIGDLLVVFQLKEREADSDTTVEAEKHWFERKVLWKATRQIKDTLLYLNTAGTIEIKNHRGHISRLDFRSINHLNKLIVYLPHDSLPEDCRRQKHHKSRTAGIIHIMPAYDYLGIVRTLLTPAEVADYLRFRQSIIDKWETEVTAITEQALIGQYLKGNTEAMPSVEYTKYLRLLEHRADEWDMSGIISNFLDRICTNNEQTQYYPIIREIALLKRDELREFKKRFQLSREAAHKDELVLPYRIACPRTGCGFVFIPMTKDLLPHRKIALENFTLLHKYELKLSKCIGVSIADDDAGWFTAEWFYAESPWKQDQQIEESLQKNYPFRNVKQSELLRYTFRDEV